MTTINETDSPAALRLRDLDRDAHAFLADYYFEEPDFQFADDDIAERLRIKFPDQSAGPLLLLDAVGDLATEVESKIDEVTAWLRHLGNLRDALWLAYSQLDDENDYD